MCVQVRGQKGQDGGNKGDEGEAEVHNLQAAKLLAVTHPCQPSFLIYDIGRDNPAQRGSGGLDLV